MMLDDSLSDSGRCRPAMIVEPIFIMFIDINDLNNDLKSGLSGSAPESRIRLFVTHQIH